MDGLASRLDLLAPAVAVGLVAAVVCDLAVKAVGRTAMARRALDHPGGRKQHDQPVPRTGGVAMTAGMVAGVAVLAVAPWHRQLVAEVPATLVVTLALGTAMVFLVGLLEDLGGASIPLRLGVEVAAAVVVVGGGCSFSFFGLPLLGDLHLGAFGPVVSVLWIVGVTNAVNLVDGLDGLAAGMVAIVAGSMVVFAVLHSNPLAVLILAAMFGACLGFLRHNRAPARIFMGDAGSLTLGFLLGAVSVVAGHKASAAVAILVPILALGIPVIDALLVVAVRFSESPKRSSRERLARIFRADRLHLHHLLEPLGRRRQRIVVWLYLLVLASCLMALTVAFTKNGTLGWTMVGVELVAVALIRHLGWARRTTTPTSAGGPPSPCSPGET